MPKLIDANLIIRYLLNDDLSQANATAKLLKTSKDPLILTDLTVAEIVWVLTSVYKLPKDFTIEKVRSLLNVETIKAHLSLLLKALEIYELHNVSFVDAYLLAYSEIEKLEGIYSFDKALDKIKEVKRFTPK